MHALEFRQRRAGGVEPRRGVDQARVAGRVEALAAAGLVTGASGRNWAGYGAEVHLAEDLPATARDLLTDPQTSGGLLLSCAPAAVDAVLARFRDAGFDAAAVIGRIEAGPVGLRVDV